MTLFDPDSLRPLARRSDPDTSHAAAAGAGAGRGGVKLLILAEFRGGEGLTDDELCDRIRAKHPERVEATIKAARSALSKERPPVLTDTGLRRLSHHNADMIVWCEPGAWYSLRN